MVILSRPIQKKEGKQNPNKTKNTEITFEKNVGNVILKKKKM